MQKASPEMMALLAALRKKVVIGCVGGSDFNKIADQLLVNGKSGTRFLSTPITH